MINKNIKDFELTRQSYLGECDNYPPLIVQRLLLNGMRTPDGTEIFSYTVHDYVTYQDKNGEVYMVDGGNEYLRRSVNKEPAEDLSVYVDEDHEINRENMIWGSYGPNGDQSLKIQKLSELDTDHIHAILDTQTHIPKWKRELFEEELRYRSNKDADES